MNLEKPFSSFDRKNIEILSDTALYSDCLTMFSPGVGQRVMSALFRYSNSIRIITSTSLRVLFLNATAEQGSILFGLHQLQPDEFLPSFLEKVLETSNKGLTLALTMDLLKAREGANISNDWLISIPKSDHPDCQHWFRINSTPLWEEAKIIGISVEIQDITRHKRIELLNKEQNDVLKEVIFDQSHKVRAPLTNILAILSILEEEIYKPLDPTLVATLKQASEQLDSIVKQVVQKTSEWKAKRFR